MIPNKRRHPFLHCNEILRQSFDNQSLSERVNLVLDLHEIGQHKPPYSSLGNQLGHPRPHFRPKTQPTALVSKMKGGLTV